MNDSIEGINATVFKKKEKKGKGRKKRERDKGREGGAEDPVPESYRVTTKQLM